MTHTYTIDGTDAVIKGEQINDRVVRLTMTAEDIKKQQPFALAVSGQHVVERTYPLPAPKHVHDDLVVDVVARETTKEITPNHFSVLITDPEY